MNSPCDHLTSQRGDALQGTLRPPGDKSISHRALMLGAIAEGTTRIRGLLESEDIRATTHCLTALGVTVEGPKAGETVVHGVGLKGLREPAAPLDCGNSGTTMRLLAGILAGQPFTSTLTGDASLSRRPMNRIIEPLELMGATINSADGRPPLVIHGRKPLTAVQYASPLASAQVKTCVLLAGLYAEGYTEVSEASASRDHTERMLQAFHCPIERLGNRTSLTGGSRLQGADLSIPADPSAAAFFAVAASIVPGSEILLEGVGVNPTRDGFIHILRHMGADIGLDNESEVGGEPVADLRIRHAPLQGIPIDPYLVPTAIDEFPALFVAAACAKGKTTLTGAGELRVKESDRIAVMAKALTTLGIRCRERGDGIQIQGGPLQGGEVDAAGDHRCAMALGIAGLAAAKPVTVHGAGNIATSFPDFRGALKALGINIQDVYT